MSTIAIVGAGPIGASIAARLAARGRVRHVRLVDAAVDVAAGKALDIRQSGPIDGFDTALSADADVLAAAGATVVVIADDIQSGEWRDDDGRFLIERLVRAGCAAPIVFAGPHQGDLMERAYRELGVPRHRLVGTAAAAIVGAVQALAALEMNLSSVELAVVGRPPAFVVGWTAASASGTLVTDRVPAHRLLAISQSIRRLWPARPEAIGAATTHVVEALVDSSRRHVPGLTILDGELGAKGAAVLLPLELGRLRVLGHVVPSLSAQEKTELLNGIRS